MPGDDGNLFFGYELDIACGLGDKLHGRLPARLVIVGSEFLAHVRRVLR